MIHVANAALVFEVFGIAQASYNMRCPDFFAKLNGKFLKGIDVYISLTTEQRLNVCDFFVGGEETLFFGVDSDANHYFVKQTERLMHDGFMAFGKRIKTSREKTAFHGLCLKKLK
jgi:hypothetical protein